MSTPVEKSQSKARAIGLTAVALWCTVATAFKLSLQVISPAQLVLLASTASWVYLGLHLTATRRWRDLNGAPKAQIALAIFAGLINPALYYGVLFAAYTILPAQEAMALNYTWALLLGLLAVPVLGQKLTALQIVCALISYSGVLVIATRGDLLAFEFKALDGIALALLSTLLWSAYWLLNTKQTLPPTLSLFLNFSGALPAIIGYCLLTNVSMQFPLQGILGATYVGLFEMGISFVLWLAAMRLATNTLAISSLVLLSPPVSLVLIATFVGEPITNSTIVGLGLILAGLVIQQRKAPA